MNEIGIKISESWCGLNVVPGTNSLLNSPLGTLTYNDTWNSWLEWQTKQAPIHFQRSDVFKKYASYNNSIMLRGRDKDIEYNTDNMYVMGDFRYFIEFESRYDDDQFWDNVKLLLDLYDCCKGWRRLICGSSTFIIQLRYAHQHKSFAQLYNTDYQECNYDIRKIHVHTVAHFSLSTLIMRFVSTMIYQRMGEQEGLLTPVFNHHMFELMRISDCYRCLDHDSIETNILNSNKITKSFPIVSNNTNKRQIINEPRSAPSHFLNTGNSRANMESEEYEEDQDMSFLCNGGCGQWSKNSLYCKKCDVRGVKK